jgi:hypothetical protein
MMDDDGCVITSGFNDSLESVFGELTIAPTDFAKLQWDLFRKNPTLYEFAVGYVGTPDEKGVIHDAELKEISLVTAIKPRMISLYTSNVTCGDCDIYIHGRYRTMMEALVEAERIRAMTLEESGYTLLTRIVEEHMSEPHQRTVEEWVRDDGAYEGGPTVEDIKWRKV